MRKLVALAALNDHGTLDEDVMNAMVALAQQYAQDEGRLSEASATDPPEPEEPEDPAAEHFNLS